MPHVSQLEDDLHWRARAEAAEAALATTRQALTELEEVERAARRWLRAKDDTSWSTEKEWHKRHDKGNAERALRDALAARRTLTATDSDTEEGET